MDTILILSLYYWAIVFSIVGYGILFNHLFLRSSEKDIGYIGIYGIFILIFISYLSSFFLPHTEIFNSAILIIGFISFCTNKKIAQENIKNLLIVFMILMIFIFVSKNHDDFSYYHFPYAHLLTEYSNMIGLGNFNHGFRTHSSIFYLSALFNLPFTNYFLLHLSPVFFLGFANIIFYNKILSHLHFKKASYILYLSLLSLIFINVFFYRLAEHGTDRSAMILIIVVICELFYLININKFIDKNLFLKLFVLLTLIVSLKTFYILYGLLLIPVFVYFLNKKISLVFLFKNVVIYLCVLTLILVLMVNFFNSGCLLYPIKNLCFESFSWSIPINEVEEMNQWYQQWAKAGANPNYRVLNPEIYIKNFNWVSNWIDKYFFNKVSDFLLGVIFLSLVLLFVFFTKKTQRIKKPKFWIIYIILVFLTVEWFYVLPTLRYGGYHLIALIFFIPLSIYLTRYLHKIPIFKKRVYFLIFLTIIIFFSRNISRLHSEYKLYDYNILNNAYFREEAKNFKIFETIKAINKCNIEKDLIFCSKDHIKVKFMNNHYIYYREKK
tara:strand:+ start:9346 stop:11001 length:1656 start_codon:yes stop_codon:yes gene_type:complete